MHHCIYVITMYPWVCTVSVFLITQLHILYNIMYNLWTLSEQLFIYVESQYTCLIYVQDHEFVDTNLPVEPLYCLTYPKTAPTIKDFIFNIIKCKYDPYTIPSSLVHTTSRWGYHCPRSVPSWGTHSKFGHI